MGAAGWAGPGRSVMRYSPGEGGRVVGEAHAGDELGHQAAAGMPAGAQAVDANKGVVKDGLQPGSRGRWVPLASVRW